MKSDKEKTKERIDRFFSRLEKRLDEDESLKKKGSIALLVEIVFLTAAVVVCFALLALAKLLRFIAPIALGAVVVYFVWTWCGGATNRDELPSQTQAVVREESPESNLDVQVGPLSEENESLQRN